MGKVMRIDANLVKNIKILRNLGVEKISFTTLGEIQEISFFANNLEINQDSMQSRVVDNKISKALLQKPTEEQMQVDADLEKLRKAVALDDLMMEDPVSYEEEILKGDMIND